MATNGSTSAFMQQPKTLYFKKIHKHIKINALEDQPEANEAEKPNNSMSNLGAAVQQGFEWRINCQVCNKPVLAWNSDMKK